MGVRSVVVLAALLLAGCSTDGTTATQHPRAQRPSAEATSTPTPAKAVGNAAEAPPPGPADVPACPPWDAEPAYPRGELPDGPTSLRACPGEETVQGPPLWKPAISAPRDALTTGVDELAALIDVLPDAAPESQDRFCSQEGRPRIQYVFGYPDGSTRTVTYGYGACHVLELEPPGDSPSDRTIVAGDARPFMAAVADALLAQRRDGVPPGRVPPAPACVPHTRPFTTLPTPELELATAALCVLDGRRWRRAALPVDLVERLTDEYGTATAGDDCASTFQGTVVGWSTWGDPVELQLSGRCAIAGSPWAPEPARWTVSPGLAEELASLPLGPPVRPR